MRRTPMKRTGFASSWVPRAKVERVLTPIRVPAPSALIFRPTPKTEYVRDESYRRFVASLPCFACGLVGFSQAAHSNQADAGKGLSIKASDAFLFPLCADQPGRRGCHSQHDLLIGMDSGERNCREERYLVRMAALVSKQVSNEVSKT